MQVIRLVQTSLCFPCRSAAAFLLLALGAMSSAQNGDWVRSQQKISDTQGGFGDSLADGDALGISVEGLGDLDGDGLIELGVGSQFDKANTNDRGSLWILSLRANGTVDHELKIAEQSGGFSGQLADGDFLGHAMANIGDLSGDGVDDIAVGATGTNDGGPNRGAVWILTLNQCISASVSTRNGSGINPMLLSAQNNPVMGQT